MTRCCSRCRADFEPKPWQLVRRDTICAKCRAARQRGRSRGGRSPEYRKAIRESIAQGLAGRPPRATAPKPTPRPRPIKSTKPKRPDPRPAAVERFHPTNPAAAALWREVLRGRA